MSGLPNAHIAVVEEDKIRRYLLSESHPAGRSKAAFLMQAGFRQTAWEDLRHALIRHGQTGQVTSVIATEFGFKYVVQGPLTTPAGRTPSFLSVWFVARADHAPRLVTAYPAEGDRE